MKKLFLCLSFLFVFSSCEVLQFVDTNKYVKENFLLILINWKHENISVSVDGAEFSIKPLRRHSLRLPEGEHTICFKGKTSTFYGRNLVTYKKILK